MATHEFRFQARRQRAKIWAIRAVVLFMIVDLLYQPPDAHYTLQQHLDYTGSAIMLLWAYTNLMNVKYDLEEMFILSPDIYRGWEFTLIATLFWIASWLV